ncbi:MAG: shikimate kinase [Polaribacter sp.]|nr:shikimate kinase [Polaribacter sp.]
MKIVLLGYMASGKSTIGKVLSQKTNMDFIDLDAYIEKKEALSIAELFASKGEVYFRIQEGRYLKEILASQQDTIISLGGGTPCYGDVMKMLLQTGITTVYLKASIGTLEKRLQSEKNTRPLIAELSKEKLTEYIGKHLFERASFYEQSSIKIQIDSKSVATIVSEIEAQLL